MRVTFLNDKIKKWPQKLEASCYLNLQDHVFASDRLLRCYKGSVGNTSIVLSSKRLGQCQVSKVVMFMSKTEN